jgi:hypothetical protein
MNLNLSIIFFFLLCSSCSLIIPEEVELEFSKIPKEVDFNYHVKPILSDRCYSCHGPDEKTRKAGLRLDIEKIAFSKLQSGNRAFYSESLYKSEVAHRILSSDENEIMPPQDSNLFLNNKEKAIILKWIDQGAKWKEHWSFIKPLKHNTPKSTDELFIKNPIDNFVFKKLKENNLSFSEETTKGKILRRVSMDLTGLPPSIDEIDDFINDQRPEAYEKVVDRLLNSIASAEMLALDWMDLSRYADSHGLHADGLRTMWPWRDWVIESFSKNMPYDQFVTWQIAGDLLPNPTRDQILATAFNRNSPMTAEGGVIDEEWRLNYVFDRTETFSTAFLGLTVACAKCHDHKFDPISQKDYYQLTAFYNNINEIGMTGDDGDYGPLLALPAKETEEKLKTIENEILKKQKELKLKGKELDEFYSYANNLPKINSSEKNIFRALKRNNTIGYFPLDEIRETTKSEKKSKRIDGTKIEDVARVSIKKYIVDNNIFSSSDQLAKTVDGVKGNSLQFLIDGDYVLLEKIPNFEWTDSFSSSVWVNTNNLNPEKTQHILGTSGDKNNFTRGWDLYLDNKNHINIRFINTMPTNIIHLKTFNNIQLNKWIHLTFSYNGSGSAGGLNLYIDGKKTKLKIETDNLYKSMHPVSWSGIKKEKRAVRVGKSGRNSTGDNGKFRGKIDDVYFYSKEISPLEALSIYNSYAIKKKEEKEEKEELIKKHWIYNNPKITIIEKDLKKLREKWLQVMEPVLEVMVMREMDTPRETFLYNRGSYTEPLYAVDSKIPENLHKMDKNLPRNRLGLAKWLFSNDNPLTSRVTVNRYWQMIFGNGIVRTPTDFGVQGMLPTHPELLDWLSIYFMENNWNVKKLLKLMVMSHSYRQSSIVTKKMKEIDPDNLLLARSGSYRLPGEIIRDNALAVSGLLVKDIGGKSVKPYQPDGLWIEKSNFSIKLLNYKKTEGDSLYRRSLYTFIRRTSPPPSMNAFDATSREICTIKREITNTPLQALVLLNDPQFFEASRVLAERIQKEGGDTTLDQISYGFKLSTSRNPKPEELNLFHEFYNSQLKYYKSNPNEAMKVLSVGDSKFDRSLNRYKTAALTMVSNTILNHDETYMKR